ncbi:MAG: hypothetical protein Q8L47_03010 [bacterium]|nr:hypothetical protein [bacterium]
MRIRSHGDYPTRKVRCRDCKKEYEQKTIVEAGCFGSAVRIPLNCPSCKSIKDPEEPIIIPVCLGNTKVSIPIYTSDYSQKKVKTKKK